jgi:hypothetical protein
MGRGQDLFRKGLEIKDVESICRLVDVRLCESPKWEGHTCHQRTAGQKL